MPAADDPEQRAPADGIETAPQAIPWRRPRSANRPPDNLAFKLLIPLAFLFCATVLIYVVSGLGDQNIPLKRLITRYAPSFLVVEVLAVVVDGLIAMTIDRRRSLRMARLQKENSRPENPDG